MGILLIEFSTILYGNMFFPTVGKYSAYNMYHQSPCCVAGKYQVGGQELKALLQQTRSCQLLFLSTTVAEHLLLDLLLDKAVKTKRKKAVRKRTERRLKERYAYHHCNPSCHQACWSGIEASDEWHSQRHKLRLSPLNTCLFISYIILFSSESQEDQRSDATPNPPKATALIMKTTYVDSTSNLNFQSHSGVMF